MLFGTPSLLPFQFFVIVFYTCIYIGPPEFNGSISVNVLSNEDNYYSVNVSWKTIGPMIDEQYIIVITPPVESGSNFITSNTSIILSALYNQEYNISIVASNCAGSSARATTTIGKFKICMVNSQLLHFDCLFYRCL